VSRARACAVCFEAWAVVGVRCAGCALRYEADGGRLVAARRELGVAPPDQLNGHDFAGGLSPREELELAGGPGPPPDDDL
jgi:hypothetical protein